MKKLNLFDKSEEIYNKIPKKYVDIILNSIIAQSVQNGTLIKEASNFLSSEDIKELSETFDIKISVRKKPEAKRVFKAKEEDVESVSFGKKETDKKKAMDNFEGFD